MQEEYRFKLFRIVEGKLYTVDISRKPDRLLRQLESLKKYASEYIVGETAIVKVLGSSKNSRSSMD